MTVEHCEIRRAKASMHYKFLLLISGLALSSPALAIVDSSCTPGRSAEVFTVLSDYLFWLIGLAFAIPAMIEFRVGFLLQKHEEKLATLAAGNGAPGPDEPLSDARSANLHPLSGNHLEPDLASTGTRQSTIPEEPMFSFIRAGGWFFLTAIPLSAGVIISPSAKWLDGPFPFLWVTFISLGLGLSLAWMIRNIFPAQFTESQRQHIGKPTWRFWFFATCLYTAYFWFGFQP